MPAKGAVAFLVIALFCWPGVSRAERHSTPHEKAAINRAARHAHADRYFRVTVSDIEVSTVNRRWATAVVALFRRKEPRAPATQEIQEWFFRAQRGWVAWFSTAMPDVEMPTPVAEDLGIAEPKSLLETIVKWVIWGVLGGVVLLVLLFFGRSSATGLGGGGGGGPVSPQQAQGPSGGEFGPAPVRQVPCDGGCQNGRVACPICGWARTVQNPETGVFETCTTCGGQLFPCRRCHGSGLVEV
jgi:hypothetical protein